MRLPLHIWVLLALLPLTFFGCRSMLVEGSGPYSSHAQISFTTVHSWPGGHSYVGDPEWRAWSRGYWQYKNSLYSYCIFEGPYWPNGALGNGFDNPPPPSVKRIHIYGV